MKLINVFSKLEMAKVMVFKAVIYMDITFSLLYSGNLQLTNNSQKYSFAD